MIGKLKPGPAAPNAMSRRLLFAGAGTAGALAAVAALLPRAPAGVAAEAVTAATAPEAAADGYQLTEHVKRYYQTARV